MALPWGFERFGVDPVGLRMSPCRSGTREATCTIPTAAAEREHCGIRDAEVLTLAAYALQVEAHESLKAGHACPWPWKGPRTAWMARCI
jgi:hypothetical protein